MTVLELTTVDSPPTDPVRARGRVLRRLLRNPLAMCGLAVVVVAVAVALLANFVAPYPFDKPDFGAVLKPPSGAHWFGTDDLGRDQFSRVLFGLRASVIVAALSVALSMLVGVPLGLAAGFYRYADPFVSRLTDTLLSFPFLLLAVGLTAIFSQSLTTVTVAIGIAQIPAVVRVTRGETLRLRELDFVAAAVADGSSDAGVLFRHILPNAFSTLIVQATVAAPAAIIGEAALSFLGLGIHLPNPSLGLMLSRAQTFYRGGPWMVVFPGLSIVVLALAFNVLGDGLRDALDPRESRR
jgi:peptide/nickel transport system permease protein